jgi:hypothetical protein
LARIESGAFQFTALRSPRMPTTVTSIAADAFLKSCHVSGSSVCLVLSCNVMWCDVILVDPLQTGEEREMENKRESERIWSSRSLRSRERCLPPFINNPGCSILVIACREMSASDMPDQMGRVMCRVRRPLSGPCSANNKKLKKIEIFHSIVFETVWTIGGQIVRFCSAIYWNRWHTWEDSNGPRIAHRLRQAML